MDWHQKPIEAILQEQQRLVKEQSEQENVLISIQLKQLAQANQIKKT